MRNNFIDLIRGIAFILMIIHHLNYFNPKNNLSVTNIVNICGTISRTVFIILVGISINLFKSNKKTNKKSKKPYLTLLGALVISLFTYILLPEKHIIYFGVLHFIAFITIILQYVTCDTKMSIIILIISLFLKDYMLTITPSDNIINLMLGSYTKTRFPLDTFPIFTWLPYVAFGMIIGDFLKNTPGLQNKFTLENLEFKNMNIFKPIIFVGKNSLFLYVMHIIPCIFWLSSKYK